MNNKKILVTTDFSELGNKAFEAAGTIVNTIGGKVTPFHVFMADEEAYKPKLRQIIEDKKLSHKKLDETARQYIDPQFLNPGKIVHGVPVNKILEAAKDYDMIVMSSHGRTGFDRLFLGSVAEKVLRFAKVPVIIVEDESNIQTINRIMVTTDFSKESEAAFPWANEIAKKSDADVDVVTIVSAEATSILRFENREDVARASAESENKLKELIDRHFPDIRHKVHAKVIATRQSAHKRLTELAGTNSYNLIVMATVGHTGLDYLVLGSTTASLVRRVETAVLVVHPE